MRRRKERTIKDLYDSTEKISEPEITPVLKGSWRIQGPMDELDHDVLTKKGASAPENKIGKHSPSENAHIRAESGACNVCAAPCSSCMHMDRTVSVMESKIEDEYSGEICRGKESKCSSNDADVEPTFKSRACYDHHRTASEASNLQSANSSHDSFSENAESKANMRTSDESDGSEDVEMLPRALSGRAIGEDKLLTIARNAADQSVFISSPNGNASDLSKKSFPNQYVEQGGLECHGDNTSCVTGIKHTNLSVDNNLDLIKKNMSCSSFVASNVLAEGFGNTVQVQIAPGCLTEFHCKVEESQHDSRKLNSGTKEASHRKSSSTSSASADSRDLEENSSILHREELAGPVMEHVETSLAGPVPTINVEHKYAALDCASILPNIEESKSNFVRSNSSSGVGMKKFLCLETDTEMDGGSLPAKAVKCAESADLNEQFEKPGTILKGSDMQETPLQPQPVPEIEHSGSDFVEDDVKVCDICGDAGREEMLAICNRCSDGAEHTYCMKIMLNKVPEGEWLCEGCQIKEDSENQKPDSSETISGTMKVPCLNGKNQKLGSTFNPKLLSKLDTNVLDIVANGAIKDITSPQVSSMKHRDNLEVPLTTKKHAREANDGSPGTASPSKKSLLFRESSFKNLDTGKVKPTNPILSSGSPTVSSQEIARSLPISSHNSPKIQSRLQSPRGVLSKSTFNNLDSKPKVKQIFEDVSQKQNLPRESAASDRKNKVLSRTISKSMSIKTTRSVTSNANESKYKVQSPNPCAEDTRGLKQAKEQNLIERRNSFKSDCTPVSLSPTAGITVPLRKADQKNILRGESTPSHSSLTNVRDTKAAELDGKLNTSCKSTLHIVNRGSENAIALVKKQGNSVEQKPSSQASLKEDTAENSFLAADYLCGKPDVLLQDGLPQSWESTNRDGKARDPSLLRLSKKTASMSSPRVSALQPSPAINSRDVMNKSNKLKLKDAVAAVMSKERRIFRNLTVPDPCDDLSMLSKEIGAEVMSKDQLSSSSNCLKNLPSPDGAYDGKENLGSSTANSSITTAVPDVKQSAIRSMEAVCAPRSGDLNAIPTLSDGTKMNHKKIFSSQASMIGNRLRNSAIPEHDYIWQGAFEVQGNERCPEFCDRIQAHLSTCASPNVLEVANKFPCILLMEEVPRLSTWPMQFQGNGVAEDNIALYFFAKDLESYESSYKNLLENMLKNDLALIGNLDGIEMLIFPSNQLPEKSQRWNNLFFLWGVFKGRQANCSGPQSGSQKFCAASLDVMPSDHDLSAPVVAGLTVSQKISSYEHMDKEISACERSPKAPEAATCIASVDFPSLPSLGREENYIQPASHDTLPSETNAASSFPELMPLTSVGQRASLLDTGSLLSTQMRSRGLCSKVKSNAASLKEVYRDSEARKDPKFQPLIQARSVQSNLNTCEAMPSHLDISNYTEPGFPSSMSERRDTLSDSSRILPGGSFPHVQETEVEHTRDQEKILEKMKDDMKERLMNNGTALEKETERADLREKAPSSLELSSKRKRPYSCSLEVTDCKSFDRGNECKKMKRYCSEMHVGNSFGELTSTYKFSSEMHDLEMELANDDPMFLERTRSTERCFFPVRDVHPSNATQRQIISSDDEDPPESEVPNLELALGAEKKSPKEMLPWFLQPGDKKGNQDKLQEPTLDNGDDEVAASLSLSLAFPFSKKEKTTKPVSKAEQVFPVRPHVNTSLHLFGVSFSGT